MAPARYSRGASIPTPRFTLRLAGRNYDCFRPVAVRVAARVTVADGARSAHFRRHREDVPESARGRADLSASRVGDDADYPARDFAADGAEADA
jgi:hypothetical protein